MKKIILSLILALSSVGFAQTAKQPLKEPGLIVVRNDTGTKLSQERVKDYLDMDSRALAIANAMRTLAKNNDIKAEVLKLSKATGQEIFFTLRSVDSDGDYHFSVRGYTASEKEALFKGINATHVVYIQNYVFKSSVVSEKLTLASVLSTLKEVREKAELVNSLRDDFSSVPNDRNEELY
mgnify:CR=1 FL=1